MEMKEIETKIRGILSIKECRQGLTPEEKRIYEKLDKKYRDKRGRLVKGSFFVNSNSEWEKA